MKIGVVSDTHNNVKNVRRIVQLFNEAEVDHVIHTGDITKATTLELFDSLTADLHGVYGNNDQERDSLDACVTLYGFQFAERCLRLELGSRTVGVVHDPLTIDNSLLVNCDLILHGHTHQLRIESNAKGLIFNPGECAGHMQGFNAIGVVDLVTLEPALIKF